MNFAYMTGFTVMLSAAPLIVEQLGSPATAGLVNSVLLLAAVIAQWISPVLVRKWNHRQLGVIGLLLLGVPSLLIAAIPSLWLVFVASGVRGFGFGLMTVITMPQIIAHSPPGTHGRSLGHVGLVTSIPAIFGPSLGIWMWRESLELVSVFAAFICLLGLFGPKMCRAVHNVGDVDHTKGIPATAILRMYKVPNLRLYSMAFMVVSVGWAGTVSFVPLLLPQTGLYSAGTFLLFAGLFRTAGRWISGPMTDRGLDARKASMLALAVMISGLVVLAGASGAVPAIAAGVLYGIGQGSIQTFTYSAIIRESPYGVSAASAVWATSIDFGGVMGTVLLSGVAVLAGGGAVLWAMPLTLLLAYPILAAVRETGIRKSA